MNLGMLYSESSGLFYTRRIHSDIPDDVIEVADEEYQLLVTGRNAGQSILRDGDKLVLSYSQEFKEGRERGWRSQTLGQVKWLRDRHRDQVDLGIDTTITNEQFNELLAYMQSLRDWPQTQEFPEIEHRPVAPAWVAEQAYIEGRPADSPGTMDA